MPSLALAEAITWPDLPDTCFVSGRSATSQDVDTGCAAFLINVKGKAAGTPIKLDIPQYAMHVDEGTGKETPVILIQAEENGDVKAVGYKFNIQKYTAFYALTMNYQKEINNHL